MALDPKYGYQAAVAAYNKGRAAAASKPAEPKTRTAAPRPAPKTAARTAARPQAAAKPSAAPSAAPAVRTAAPKPAAKAEGGSYYASDKWTGPDSTPVVDVYGNYTTLGELRAKKASGYYDRYEAGLGSGGSAGGGSRASGREEDSQDDTRTAARRKAAQQAAAQAQTYRDIVQEAYAAYRRSRASAPELAAGLAAGAADDLFGENDRAFQAAVQEAARQRGQDVERVTAQIRALLDRAAEKAQPWQSAAQSLSAQQQALAGVLQSARAAKESALPQAAAAQLQSWYQTLTPTRFAEQVRRALARGALTQAQVDAWQKNALAAKG